MIDRLSQLFELGLRQQNLRKGFSSLVGEKKSPVCVLKSVPVISDIDFYHCNVSVN